MSYLGRRQLGQWIDLRVLCVDAAGTPQVPAAAPHAVVHAPDGSQVFAADMAVLDRFAQTGLFHYPLFLGEDFAAGSYRVVYRYQAGSHAGLGEDGFEVVPGGDPDGAVVAMHWYARPQARFIVYQLDSGALKQGRNPTW